jgi:prepilin-type N-terminal cleavage/methylation domain-containing protein
MHLSRRSSRGFTLVELLVVIAIIGILIALLLPAVQAARESARRMQCVNHLKQIALASHVFSDRNKSFPTGGLVPWPEVTMANGQIAGPEKQAMGWAFQVLPFLEQDAIYRLPADNYKGTGNMPATQVENLVGKIVVTYYFCPSRRKPAKQDGLRTLMDYAGMTSGQTVNGTYQSEFWANADAFSQTPPSGSSNWYQGIMTRTRYSKPGRPEDVTDGLSNTIMFGEKWLDPSLYETGAWHDDRGWTDGWDPDVMRSSSYFPRPDSIGERDNSAFAMGGAHSGGFNAAAGDASVHFVSFNIDRETYRRLGHREDQLPVGFEN